MEVPAGNDAPRASVAVGSFGVLGAVTATQSNLALTQPLLWAMIAISTAGSIVTFAFLVYALWRFRDPSVKRRRYG